MSLIPAEFRSTTQPLTLISQVSVISVRRERVKSAVVNMTYLGEIGILMV